MGVTDNMLASWTLVVAMDRNGVIGKDGDLPWRLSSDLRRFKKITMGHALVMGRKTFESIGRPLPGRQTIVLSRKGLESPSEVEVVGSLEEIDSVVEPGREVMVVGGGQIYEVLLPRCGTVHLTRVHVDVKGDACFPSVDWDTWSRTHSELVPAGEKDDWESTYEIWERKTR